MKLVKDTEAVASAFPKYSKKRKDEIVSHMQGIGDRQIAAFVRTAKDNQAPELDFIRALAGIDQVQPPKAKKSDK